MLDLNFPIIDLTNEKKENWGFIHGESFKEAIKELSDIRRELMIQKNPKLKNHIEELAGSQLLVTKMYDEDLYDELVAISTSSSVSLVDLVILNNYTDFRDIEMHDEGCTTISALDKHHEVGQTWDMHSSAKNYICLLKFNDKLVFSLAACLGMMGVNSQGIFVGVNNINTKNAQAALLWPTLVRKLLDQNSISEQSTLLYNAPVTSGHNYLLSDGKKSEHWEVSPQYKEKVLTTENFNNDYLFHTNHCLGKNNKSIEDKISGNSTTFIRYEKMEDFNSGKLSEESLFSVLTNHDGYPKSLCSHFMANQTDPSMTCGGATYNYQTKIFHTWRGCPEHDENYVEHKLEL